MSEGCCRAAVDSEGFAHDHAEWHRERDEARADLAAAEARGWLKAATALRNKPGAEDWPLVAADWLVEHAFDLESTGGQP